MNYGDDIEVQTNGRLQRLRAEMDRAVDGPHASREATRDVAREYRTLRARLIEGRTGALSGDLADTGLVLAGYTRALAATDRNIEEARARVLQVFGTAGWDEPETSTAAPARPSIGLAQEPTPLTDEEVASLITDAEDAVNRGAGPAEWFDAADVLRLAREVRRLRSDEWPERAAAEVLVHLFGEAGATETATVAAILRRHRDGKA